ncbi:MAG: hypothetical protein ACRCZK_01570, partial [Oscillospiraceae bacterium]
ANAPNVPITITGVTDVNHSITDINKNLKVIGLALDTSYIVRVTVESDLNGDGLYQSQIRDFVFKTLDASGINLGIVTVEANAVNRNDINIVFNNSFGLNNIQNMVYAVYDPQGRAILGTMPFVTITEGASKIITIDTNLTLAGLYSIQLEFTDVNGDILKTHSINYRHRP